MPETVDPEWAEEVLIWWIEHGVAALKINAGAHHHERPGCPAGPATDAMLEREMQTRRVIGVVLGIENLEALVRVGGPTPGGRRGFIELETGINLARRALGHKPLPKRPDGTYWERLRRRCPLTHSIAWFGTLPRGCGAMSTTPLRFSEERYSSTLTCRISLAGGTCQTVS